MKRLAVVVLVVLCLVGSATVAEAKSKHKAHRPSSACLNALTYSEKITADGSEFASAVQEYFSALSENSSVHSAVSDLVGFLNGMTTATRELTAKVNGITVSLQQHRLIYKQQAAQCRAGN